MQESLRFFKWVVGNVHGMLDCTQQISVIGGVLRFWVHFIIVLWPHVQAFQSKSICSWSFCNCWQSLQTWFELILSEDSPTEGLLSNIQMLIIQWTYARRVINYDTSQNIDFLALVVHGQTGSTCMSPAHALVHCQATGICRTSSIHCRVLLKTWRAMRLWLTSWYEWHENCDYQAQVKVSHASLKSDPAVQYIVTTSWKPGSYCLLLLILQPA